MSKSTFLIAGPLRAARDTGKHSARDDLAAGRVGAPRNPFMANAPSWTMRRLALAWTEGYRSVRPLTEPAEGDDDTEGIPPE
ncbi:hypothetical protein D1871_11060 [Nakamurella silvestris]|nr:hypothetical protein D1871_11060 [Nakamurella silvestris]